VFASVPTMAATIEIDSLLTNPSFEANTGACPTGWNCGGSPGTSVYSPGSAQYTAGSDGLASGIVPDGVDVAYMPSNGIAGSGSLSQVTGTDYIAGDTYTFTFWAAIPLANVAGTTTATLGAGTTVEVGFTERGVQDGLPAPVQIALLANGLWDEYTITLTPAELAASSATGHQIGVMLFASTAANQNTPFQVDFDIAPVPIPAALPLFATGLGMIGLLGWRRKKSAAIAAV